MDERLLMYPPTGFRLLACAPLLFAATWWIQGLPREDVGIPRTMNPVPAVEFPSASPVECGRSSATTGGSANTGEHREIVLAWLPTTPLG